MSQYHDPGRRSSESSPPAWVWFLHLGVGRWAVSGQAAREGRGSSSLALLQAHYQSAHHWVRNGCRQDSNKYTPVRVDVIGVMKREKPLREGCCRLGLQVAENSVHHPSPPTTKKQRTGAGEAGSRREAPA